MSEKPTPPLSMTRWPIMNRIRTFLRITNVRLRFIFLMVLVGLIAGHWESIMNYYDRWRRPVRVSAMVEPQDVEYFCPMHPNIVRAGQGTCPICGMPLSKRAKTAAQSLPKGVLSRVQLTPQKVQMGRIATSPVGYRLLSREIRTVGVVDYDETKLAYISARIKGRIDKLMVNYVGQQITKGDPLAWIYSPDLLVTQKDLLAGRQWADEDKKDQQSTTSVGRSFADAARQRLLLWGVAEQQINDLILRGTPETHLTILSPIGGIVTEKNVLEGDYVNEGTRIYTIADLSTVWMQAKVFEDQIAGVSVGTAVEVTSSAYPNEIFAGRITFIAYTVDPATRTIASRVEIANPNYKLRPGMYAHAVIRLPVGKVTELSMTSQPAGEASQPGNSAGGVNFAKAYLTVASALAHDKTDSAGLAELDRRAREYLARCEGEARAKVRSILDRVSQMRDKDIKVQRDIFKSLSAKMIELMRLRPPLGMTLYAVTCPMAKADWLSDADKVENPYYGSEMFECGHVTGEIKPGAVTVDERFVTGHYCPIYPDRLYEKAELCPIDKFPMKYARIEKVLAVPESAVINTGTRRVVYRESGPGTYDMIEVKVGHRAGEYYPVLAGLSAGDRVATAGAFLVDAENRLNPAASATYFGASEGPSGGGHEH